MPLHAEHNRLNGCPRSAPRLTLAGPSVGASLSAALSDEEIVHGILAGDLPSFELIMRRYNQRIFRIARTILHDSDEAEDIVQETYLRAFEHLSQFEGRSKFSTWLTRIAIHEASARRRKLRRMNFFDVNPADADLQITGDATDHGARRSSMRELHDILADAVQSLPEQLRTVFMLRMVEGLDTAEVAACLDMSESNVKVALHRARALLQQRIDRTLGEEIRRLYQFDGERCDRIVNNVLQRIAMTTER